MFPGELDRGKEGLLKISSELERQADIYKGLGISKDDIMGLLTPRPEGLPEDLNIPVVTLGTSVDITRQFEFVGIHWEHRPNDYFDITGSVAYDSPHLIWMQDGSKYIKRPTRWVVNKLGRDKFERPSTLNDCAAFAIVHPDLMGVLRDHDILFPGTRLMGEHNPKLFVWNDHIYVKEYRLDVFDDREWDQYHAGGKATSACKELYVKPLGPAGY